jgi:predicted NBD/HSP70 family sugar kinase
LNDLATGLSNLVTFYNPQVIALGGGFGQAQELYDSIVVDVDDDDENGRNEFFVDETTNVIVSTNKNIDKINNKSNNMNNCSNNTTTVTTIESISSVLKNKKSIRNRIETLVDEKTLAASRGVVHILPAKLGNDAGAIGAALFACD